MSERSGVCMWGGGDGVGLIGSFRCGSLVTMERWTSDHRAFAVEKFFRNKDSTIRN